MSEIELSKVLPDWMRIDINRDAQDVATTPSEWLLARFDAEMQRRVPRVGLYHVEPMVSLKDDRLSLTPRRFRWRPELKDND